MHPVEINYIVIVPLQFWLKVNQCNHHLSHATLVLAPGIKLSVVATQTRSLHMSRTRWQSCFDAAAVDGSLKCPGVAGLSVLCESNGMHNIPLADIEFLL